MPTGQISTQAMHCVHDQTVSGLMPPAPSRGSAAWWSGPMRSWRADADRRPRRLLAQVEHQVARRERVAGRAAGHASWHLPHFVQASRSSRWRQVRSAMRAVADLLRLRGGRQRRQHLPGVVVANGNLGRAGEHVQRLRERDRGDERRVRRRRAPTRGRSARWRQSRPRGPPRGTHGRSPSRSAPTSRTTGSSARRGTPRGRSPVSARKKQARKEHPVADHVRPAIGLRSPGRSGRR